MYGCRLCWLLLEHKVQEVDQGCEETLIFIDNLNLHPEDGLRLLDGEVRFQTLKKNAYAPWITLSAVDADGWFILPTS